MLKGKNMGKRCLLQNRKIL